MKTNLLLVTLAAAGLAAAADNDFGLVGITSLETARLAAFCDGSVAPTPCVVNFQFEDMQGNTLKQATMTMQPGTGGFLDFAVARAFLAGGRVEIDPCWTVERGAARVSLEILDTLSQRTRTLINWGDRPQTMMGDVDFGMAGLTIFDTARLSAVCEGDGSVAPPPCNVSFEFHDIQGATIKQSRMVLQPGTGGFVDLTFRETRSTARRVEIDPCFTVADGAAIGTFALIDSLTGLTIAQTSPAALVAAEVR